MDNETAQDIRVEFRCEMAAINKTLERIAFALEGWNNAAIRHSETEPDGIVQLYAITHST